MAAFTEFYCRSGGSNLNGGGQVSGSEQSVTAAYTCVNSNWDGTSVFTPTDGSTPASSVSVGDWASVFLDAATVAVYIGRVTAVAAGVNGAITVSTTAKSGTAPTAGATGRSIKVGGAWKGPNAAEAFPIGFVTAAQTNAAGDYPRINFKNTATYSITAATTSANGPAVYQGYTTTAGDGGKATIDGGVAGASYVLLSTGNDVVCADLIFQNNGASGSASGLSINGSRAIGFRCVVNSVRGVGFVTGSTQGLLVQCEAYACNQSNTADLSGFSTFGNAMLLRCISHDNAGSNTSGFRVTGSAVTTLSHCISDTNGGIGIRNDATGSTAIHACDSYNNGSHGLASSTTSSVTIVNCNFVKNGGWGILFTAATNRLGYILNCGFGSGTQANASGTITLPAGTVESGSVTYAADTTPWVAPTTGDFRIAVSAARAAGLGAFTETQASYTGTVGFPDIGAAQSSSLVGSGGSGSGGGIREQTGVY